MGNELVKYSNKMNNMPLKNFEKIDLNFFYAICSKVREKGTDLVEIPLEELKEITGYRSTSAERFNEDLKRMNQKLISCNGQFETDEEIVFFNLFSTFRIVKSKSILKVRVNSDMTWLLNNIASQFTAFELQEFVGLSGIYSKALYRLLKQWKTKGCTPEYRIDAFKELMACPNYAPKDVMKEVINPAVEEIKESKLFDDLSCEVVYAKKRGKPVEGYIFHFGKENRRITFDDVEEYTEGMTSEQKAAVVKAANNMLKEKKKKPKKNSFNDFPQRDYDFEQLEKELLSY